MTENNNDKLSIKNILFSKAIANYVPPVTNDGHKLYGCTDCGDRFIFESSLDYHVSRKSLKITYMCRHCNTLQSFSNRCNLLAHIRSHAFKTATINVSDLKIEPLPLSEYNIPVIIPDAAEISQEPTVQSNKTKSIICFHCTENIAKTGIVCRDRAIHYSKKSDETHICPICQYTFPSKCALSAHIRIHCFHLPAFCPDCGIRLTINNMKYPYKHNCESFRVMRENARVKCPLIGCQLIHPSELPKHIKTHIRKVYKCSSCIVACYNQDAIEKHLKKHHGNIHKAIVFFQCLMCPGRLVLQHQLTNHVNGHYTNELVYPCHNCKAVYKNPEDMVKHYSTCTNSSPNNNKSSDNPNTSFRVIKRCDQCKRGFTYTCKFNEIEGLPAECPFGCIPGNNSEKDDKNNEIICGLCKNKIKQDWIKIQEHFGKFHKDHKCVDVKIKLKRFDQTPEYANDAGSSACKVRKIENSLDTENNNKNLTCKKCKNKFTDRTKLEEHMITHRDPCTAYQCLECGDCYVVKPSFSKHLLLEHGISDVDNYITTKQCFNENALAPYQEIPENTEPLKDNQCNICREQFENHDDLEKHFRVHGMAFLLKNTQKKSP